MFQIFQWLWKLYKSLDNLTTSGQNLVVSVSQKTISYTVECEHELRSSMNHQCGSIRERSVQFSLAKHLRKEKQRKTKETNAVYTDPVLCLISSRMSDEKSTGLSAPKRAISMQAFQIESSLLHHSIQPGEKISTQDWRTGGQQATQERFSLPALCSLIPAKPGIRNQLALLQLLSLKPWWESMEIDATLLCTLISTDNRNNHGITRWSLNLISPSFQVYASRFPHQNTQLALKTLHKIGEEEDGKQP